MRINIALIIKDNQVLILIEITELYTISGRAPLATYKKFKGQDGNMVEKTEYNLVMERRGFSPTRKGSFIKGEIQTRSWEKDGQKRYTTEIVVNEFKF